MANDVKLAYISRSTLTCTLASLANDSTNLLAGRQTTVIDNTSNLYTEYGLSGRITAGTSPTANNTIELWAFALLNDSGPVYPDTLGASDAAVTITSTNVKNSALFLAKTITVEATSNRSYDFGPISVKNLFGFIPDKFGFFIINGTGVALHATSGNHFLLILPSKLQIV